MKSLRTSAQFQMFVECSPRRSVLFAANDAGTITAITASQSSRISSVLELHFMMSFSRAFRITIEIIV